MRSARSKIVPLSEAAALGKSLREAKKTIVSTNGCFDVLHLGHLRYLAEGRKLGDVLVVGLNSDSSVRDLKGPERPIFPEDVRLEQLGALECVDHVVLFTEKTPERFLEALRPHIHVKGGDYEPDALPEKKIVEAGGGRIQLLPFVQGYSTSALAKTLEKL